MEGRGRLGQPDCSRVMPLLRSLRRSDGSCAINMALLPELAPMRAKMRVSGSSLLALSDSPRRPKAGASSTHSTRFAMPAEDRRFAQRLEGGASRRSRRPLGRVRCCGGLRFGLRMDGV